MPLLLHSSSCVCLSRHVAPKQLPKEDEGDRASHTPLLLHRTTLTMRKSVAPFAHRTSTCHWPDGHIKLRARQLPKRCPSDRCALSGESDLPTRPPKVSEKEERGV